jgi:hypothetical protein
MQQVQVGTEKGLRFLGRKMYERKDGSFEFSLYGFAVEVAPIRSLFGPNFKQWRGSIRADDILIMEALGDNGQQVVERLERKARTFQLRLATLLKVVLTDA